MAESKLKWIIAWEPIRLPETKKKQVLLFHSLYQSQDEAKAACLDLQEKGFGESSYYVASWPHEELPGPESIIEIENEVGTFFVPTPPKWVIGKLDKFDEDESRYLYHSGYDAEEDARDAIRELNSGVPLITGSFSSSIKELYEVAYWPHDIIPDEICFFSIEHGVARHYKNSPFQHKSSFILYQGFDLDDGAKHYPLVASIRLNEVEELDSLAKLGADWIEEGSVSLYVDNPRPILKGDVVERVQLDSSLSTYQFDGNSFVEAPIDIHHQHSSEVQKPPRQEASPTFKLPKKDRKHRP